MPAREREWFAPPPPVRAAWLGAALALYGPELRGSVDVAAAALYAAPEDFATLRAYDADHRDRELLGACVTLERAWEAEGFAALEALGAALAGRDVDGLAAGVDRRERWAMDACVAIARLGWLRAAPADPWPEVEEEWGPVLAERRAWLEDELGLVRRREGVVRGRRVEEVSRSSFSSLRGRLASCARWLCGLMGGGRRLPARLVLALAVEARGAVKAEQRCRCADGRRPAGLEGGCDG